jgi:hypothetical protein
MVCDRNYTEHGPQDCKELTGQLMFNDAEVRNKNKFNTYFSENIKPHPKMFTTQLHTNTKTSYPVPHSDLYVAQ